MNHNCSEKCSNCKNLKKKLELYENFVKDMKDIELPEEKSDVNFLAESVIIEKDNFGNLNKKIKSDLTESFLVVENGKNLDELNKREQDAIKEQDSYSNYQNAGTYYKKANAAYQVAYYALKIGKWLILL